MYYFKFTRTHAVKAENEDEARKLITSDPQKYLDSETVTRTEYKRQPKAPGLVGAAMKQVLGN